MLVLTHTDALRVNLHEFCQRVHQPATDGDGTAHGHILIGKLLAGDLGSRVDARAVLAHHIHAYTFFIIVGLLQDVARLAAGRSVTYGNGVDFIFLGNVAELDHRLHARPFGLERIHHIVIEQVPLRIQAHHLASRSDSRVDTHHALLPQRSRQEQLAQISGKHVDGFFVGFLLAGGRNLRLNGRRE